MTGLLIKVAAVLGLCAASAAVGGAVVLYAPGLASRHHAPAHPGWTAAPYQGVEAVGESSDEKDDRRGKIEAAVLAVRRTLRDPDAAKFESVTWSRERSPKTGEVREGVCGFVNGKNSYGGYVGRTLFHVEIGADGSLGEVRIADEYLWRMIGEATCATFGIRDPELVGPERAAMPRDKGDGRSQTAANP